MSSKWPRIRWNEANAKLANEPFADLFTYKKDTPMTILRSKRMLTGAELIVSERVRQMEHEGYTSAHDDQHALGELALASATYAIETTDPAYLGANGHSFFVSQLWPFDDKDWKPSGDRIRDLVKAGALIAAEIDRLQRLKGQR